MTVDAGGSSLRRGRLSDEVFRHLLAMIARGDVKPGEPLPSVTALARTFAVSSRVARETIAALAARGLVRIEHGRGCFITSRDDWRLVDGDLIALLGRDHALPDLFEVRATFEVGMAALAARRRTDADLEGLRALLDHARADSRVEAQVEGDRCFHEALALASHNPLFLPLLRALLGPLVEYWTLSQQLPNTAERAYQGHLAIYERVAARDEDGAAQAVLDHLRAGQGICERLLDGSSVGSPLTREPTVAEVSREDVANSSGQVAYNPCAH